MIFMLFLYKKDLKKIKFAYLPTLKYIETFLETRHFFCLSQTTQDVVFESVESLASGSSVRMSPGNLTISPSHSDGGQK